MPITEITELIESGKPYMDGNKYINGCVYLIHFERPYKHAGHYLGWAHDFDARMERHRKGRGANLLKVIQDVGIDWKVVRVWEPADPLVEAELKKYHNNRRLCPICSGRLAMEKAANLREMRRMKRENRDGASK